MIETKNDGGPAFPVASYNWPGMSLRDWFAGQALLAGMLSDANVCGPDFIVNSTRLAYECADAMLKAREKQ